MTQNGNGNGHYRAADFLPHILGSGGIISTIARRVGCDWHTAKKYIDEYATLQKAYQDELSANLDVAESIVVDNLRMQRKQQLEKQEPADTGDARWFLSTKGQERGYGNKLEVDQTVKGKLLIEYVNDWRGDLPTDTS